MKLISFNVNGIRAITGKIKNGEKKGSLTNNVLKNLIEEQQPDILCLQEVKTQQEGDLAVLAKAFPNLYYTFSKEKKGYSGVAMATKETPEWVRYDFEHYDESVIGQYNSYDWMLEGRIITAKFSSFIVVGVYTPNAQPELARIQERVEWEKILRNYLTELEKEFQIPVLLCGDLNCAHQEIDLHNPKGKKNTPGFSTQERKEFQSMIDAGFVDSFRQLHPVEKKYTYWSNFANSRARNVGWRIDYVLVSKAAKDKIQAADCLNEYHGSDHCPVMIEIKV
jgi:exodeoxyribonuclease III